MKEYIKNSKEAKNQSVANALSHQKNDTQTTFQLVDNRAKTVAQSSLTGVIQRMPPKYKKHQADSEKAKKAGDEATSIKLKEKELKGRRELDAKKQDKKHIDHTAREQDKLDKRIRKKAAEDEAKRKEGMIIKGGIKEGLTEAEAKKPGSWAAMARKAE